MSLLTLPEPDSWSAADRRYPLLLIGGGVFVALSVAFGVHNLLLGDPLSAFVLVGFAGILILVAAGGSRASRGRTVPRVLVDSTGTTLRPDRVFEVLLLSALAVGVPVGLVIVIFTLTGDLTMFVPRQGVIGSVVLGASTAGFPIAAFISASQRGGMGYVKMTPDGVEIVDIVRTTYVPWQDVVEVTDHVEKKIRTRKPVVLQKADGSKSRIDGADTYVPHGAGLYWMVRHYWLHADDRCELVDERAARRLSDGRFDVE